MLSQALDPRSVAVIGASDNPHKIGGRPILYMKRYGFRGAIYPVNPAREQVQGLTAYPDIDTLPDTPDLVVVAVGGEEALRAVQACARRGVRAAVVMASCLGETGEAGRRAHGGTPPPARPPRRPHMRPTCQGPP